MSMWRKVKRVETIFRQADQEVERYRIRTGLRCIPHCGRCCEKLDIEITVTECLPLAYKLYTDGHAYPWLEKLKEQEGRTLCALFSPERGSGPGHCTFYQYRPLFCRLFGFSALLNKNGRHVLVTCNPVKKAFPLIYQSAQTRLDRGLPAPVMKNYYFKLYSLDPQATRHFHINTAFRRALEEVMSFYFYRNRRIS